MTGIDKKLAAKLQSFLEKGGAQILDPTNPWELARFRTDDGISVIYQNRKGGVSYSNEHAHNAYTAFNDDKKWSATKQKDRIKRKTVEELLVERDGATCFFCGTTDFTATNGKPTLEHLLSISEGGNNHLSNLVLACETCNKAAGSLPIIEKVKLRESNRK